MSRCCVVNGKWFELGCRVGDKSAWVFIHEAVIRDGGYTRGDKLARIRLEKVLTWDALDVFPGTIFDGWSERKLGELKWNLYYWCDEILELGPVYDDR